MVASALVSASGCGSDGDVVNDSDGSPSSASSSSGSSGASSSGASSSSGSSGGSSSGASSGVLPDGAIPDVEFNYDAPARPDSDACAQTTAFATLKPLDMYVMMDRSGSMNEPGYADSPAHKGDCNVGDVLNPPSKWCYAINALSSYFKSSAASGNSAALQFFFDQNFGQGESPTNCWEAVYSSSYYPGGATGYTTLPSSAFDTALNAFYPQGSTPTDGALRGIIEFTGRTANQIAGHVTVGIVITDGDPSTIAPYCTGDITTLSNMLQTHYTLTKIPTFVIGMTGANFTNLETLAGGGNGPVHPNNIGALTNTCGNGAATCRSWNVGDGTGGVLAEAMKQIQGFAIACQYQMPKPPVGVVNPNDVSVQYLQNGVPPAKSLVRVNDQASCVANGWYYDNNASPTTITLCPAQCTSVQADANAKIDVSLGCLGG